VTVHPDWETHPLVARAMQKHGEDLRSVLLALGDALNAIEEHLPITGATIADVLSAVGPDKPTTPAKAAVAGLMLSRGCDVLDVDQAVGRDARVALAERMRADGHTAREVSSFTHLNHADYGQKRFVSPTEIEARRLEIHRLTDLGRTANEIAAELKMSVRSVVRYRNGKAPKGAKGTSRHLEIGAFAIVHGIDAAVKEFGCCRQNVKNAMWRFRKDEKAS